MAVGSNAPVIIKRKKIIGGDGHHGGAWKVAYADFVTAMMAFFMLMWLLNATTEKQRKGIADYFNPTIAMTELSAGGSGMFGGDSVFSEETLSKVGTGATNLHHLADDRSRGASGLDSQSGDGAETEDRLETLEEMLTGRSGESMVSNDLLRHIVTRVTDEGLIVELFDLPGATLFEDGSDRPTELLRDLVRVVEDVFGLVENPVALSAHVPSVPVVSRDNPVWDRTAGRALAVKGLLADEGRVDRVTGNGDRRPAVGNPMDVRNARVELVLLRDR